MFLLKLLGVALIGRPVGPLCILTFDLPLVPQQRIDQRLLHLPLVGRRRRRRRRKRLGSETAAGRDAF